jgi:hypothetical protein
VRSEDGDIGIGSRNANRDAWLPEALPFEGPVMAFGVGSGEASALKAQGCEYIIAGAQLVLAPEGGGLDPEKLFAGTLGNGSHAISLNLE